MKKSEFQNVAATVSRQATKPVRKARSDPPSYPPHRHGRKAVIFYTPVETSNAIRTLAIQQNSTLQALCIEAIEDLFAKYGVG